MVERFNGRISEVIGQTRFKSAAELEATLTRYVQAYNPRIPQRALDHRTPIQALQKRRTEKPDLFSKRVDDLPGLDLRHDVQDHACRQVQRATRLAGLAPNAAKSHPPFFLPNSSFAARSL